MPLLRIDSPAFRRENIAGACDRICEYLLYILIFCLPFSKTVIEICASTCIFLFFLKRFSLYGLKIHKYLPQTPLNKYLYIFVFFCVLSTSLSSYPLVSLRALFSKTLEYILIFFIAIEILHSNERAKRFLFVVGVSFLLIAIDAAWQHGTGKDFLRGNPLYSLQNRRLRASFSGSAGFAAWLLCISPILVGYLFSFRRKISSYGAFILSVIFLVLLVRTYSRSAWLSLFLSIFCLLPWIARAIGKMRSRQKILFLGSFAIVFLLFSFYLFLFPEHRHRDIWHMIRLDDIAIQNRLRLWEQSIMMIREKPFLGWGLNTYSKIVPDYQIFDKGFYYPHSSLLHLTVEIGVVGAVSFVVILFRFYSVMLRRIWKKRSLILIGAGVGITSLIMHSLFDTTLYTLQLAVLFWVMLAFALTGDENAEALVSRHS